jgi:hypothetical protein
MAADNRNPYKQQYQSQLARARQMNKEVMAELAKSKKMILKVDGGHLLLRNKTDNMKY